VVLGSVRVCGRVAALGGATRSAAGLAGGGGAGFGFGFGAGVGCAAAGWPTVAAAVTDAVLRAVAVVPVAAQPARAPTASTAPIVRHFTIEGHTRIGGGCTLPSGAVPAGCRVADGNAVRLRTGMSVGGGRLEGRRTDAVEGERADWLRR
jgi:hypothetical protein